MACPVFGFVKQSGGDVQVNSVAGQGTTFTLYLPQESAADSPQTALPSSAPVALAGSSKRRILVVEDNADVGSFTTQMLKEHGYQVSLALCAEDALAQLSGAQGQFDAVFSDVVMPGMGGLALAKELRRSRPQTPVILTSGYNEAMAEGGIRASRSWPSPIRPSRCANCWKKCWGPPESQALIRSSRARLSASSARRKGLRSTSKP